MKNPKYYEWNVELQQAIGGRYVVSLNYAGNHGHDEIVQNWFGNQYSAKGFGGLPTTAPDARFGEIRELTNQGRSNYDGLVASFKWQMTTNFTGAFNYTWGHSLDTVSNAGLEPYSGTSVRYLVSPNGVSNATGLGTQSFSAYYIGRDDGACKLHGTERLLLLEEPVPDRRATNHLG